MSRGSRILVVLAILVGSAVLAGVAILWADAHQATSHLLLGLALLVIGAGLTTLNLTVRDDFLRRHFGEPARVRRVWRRGWIPMLLGAAMLGLVYLDHQARAITAEAQYTLAIDRGRTAAKAGDWQAAADAFSEAIRLDPIRAEAHANRGAAFIHLGDPDRAVADFSEAIRLDPTNARVIYNRGVALYRKGAYDGALSDLSEAIRLDPNFALAYLARSMAHRAKGDDAKASADRAKAIELDPSLNKAGNVEFVGLIPVLARNGTADHDEGGHDVAGSF